MLILKRSIKINSGTIIFFIIINIISLAGCNEIADKKNVDPITPQVFKLHADVNDYASFPVIVRTDDKLVVFYKVQPLEKLKQKGAPHPHYQPYFEYLYSISKDNGRTWTKTENPPVLRNIQDISRAFVPLKNNEILDMRFRHKKQVKGFEQTYVRIYKDRLFTDPVYKLKLSKLKKEFPNTFPFDSIRLNDGSILTAGYHGHGHERPENPIEGKVFKENWPEDYNSSRPVLWKGSEDGRKWEYLSEINNDHAFNLDESSLVQFDDGRIVMVIRSTWRRELEEYWPAEVNGNGMKRDGYGYYMFQSESKDGGKNWTEPEKLDIWGHPPCLVKLESGNVLMVYGHRRPPFSIRAILSTDNCRTWDGSTMKTIYTFRHGGIDLGYPVATQLEDGRIFVTFYGMFTDNISFRSPHAVYGALFNEKWLIQ